MTASEPSGNHPARELAQTLAEHGPEPVNRWIGLPCLPLPEFPSGTLREDRAGLIIGLAAGALRRDPGCQKPRSVSGLRKPAPGGPPEELLQVPRDVV